MIKLAKIKKLLSITESRKTLKQAIISSDFNYVRNYLNNHYYDLNDWDNQHNTLLDHAIMAGNLEILTFLIEKGAKFGTYFYKIKDEKVLIEKIELLHKANYDFNLIDRLGFTIMHYAKSLNFDNAVEKLISYDPDMIYVSENIKMPVRYSKDCLLYTSDAADES